MGFLCRIGPERAARPEPQPHAARHRAIHRKQCGRHPCGDDSSRMTKLTTDPARQAHDAFRGYIYQVVRSVLAWIDLGDGEELYLEGAEDLDRIGPDGARVDQIKYTARRITLRTPSVMDAINNYWRHAKRNPHVKIRSEEHTSELQSLMRISYAVFCLKKKRSRQ